MSWYLIGDLTDNDQSRPVPITLGEILRENLHPIVPGLRPFGRYRHMGDVISVKRPVLHSQPDAIFPLLLVNHDSTQNNHFAFISVRMAGESRERDARLGLPHKLARDGRAGVEPICHDDSNKRREPQLA